MAKFFRHVRQRLLDEQKISKYLKYAGGEIVLLVIGILIAFQIEDWYEHRKTDAEINKVYQRIILDIEGDLRKLNQVSDYYMARKPVFERVMKDSINADLFDQGLSRLVGEGSNAIIFNDAGVAQLKAFNTKNKLALSIIRTYDGMEESLTSDVKGIMNIRREFINTMRNASYTWFPEWMNLTIMKDNSSPELQAYFLTSQEYKNFVADMHNMVFKNYLPKIKFFSVRLLRLRTDLKIATEATYAPLSPEELAALTGLYTYSSMDCSMGEPPVDPNELKELQFSFKVYQNTLWLIDHSENDSSELMHDHEDVFVFMDSDKRTAQFIKNENSIVNEVLVRHQMDSFDCTASFVKEEN